MIRTFTCSRAKHLFCLILSCALLNAASATVFTVINTNDAGTGSFRQALTSALAAGAGPHIVDASGVTGTISLQSALPTISGLTLTVNGPAVGAGTLAITRGSATGFRIFTIDASVSSPTLTFNRITISNGNSGASNGGGLQITSASVTINSCTITGCATTADGGGLSLEGVSPVLTVDASTFSNNSANRGGGLSAINVSSGAGTITMTGCAVINNTTTSAAGGLNMTTTSGTFRNCTISGNQANNTAGVATGGGITCGSSGNANMVNCTVTDNRAIGTSNAAGGGMRASNSSSNVSLTNTVFAGNFSVISGNSSADDLSWAAGPVNKTSSYSVVGALSGATAFNSSTQSTAGTSASPAVVNLAALAYNGGPTMTHRLLASSPELAIDQGSAPSPALSSDQRGALRVVDNAGITNAGGGDGSDIGAFETGNFVWRGGSSTVFGTAANWLEGVLPGSSAFVLTGPVTNEPTVTSSISIGALSLGAGRTLTINSGVTLTATSIGTSGTLKGNGTLNCAAVTNNGNVAPGTSPGTLTLTGSFDNSPGTLDMELGGTTAGTGYDQLVVNGAATLGGTLNVSLISGFTPLPGNMFTLMTFASRTGTFSATNLPNIAPRSWSITYNATSVVLTVVGALPLRLVSFDGSVVKGDGMLRWTAVDEKDMDRYEVEWSKDGSEWRQLGRVAAQNSQHAAYEFRHAAISGQNFYRLGMVETSGVDRRSAILRLDGPAQPRNVRISPNPAGDLVRIDLGSGEEASVSITDLTGKMLVPETKIEAQGVLSLSTLKPGIYLLAVKQNGATAVYRLTHR